MNIEEIDKWLKEQYGISYTEMSDEFNSISEILSKKGKEIERLKERLGFYESDDDTVLMSKEKWEEIKQELQIEKATNKELLSKGADLESKLYEEQDKNKRLNNIINGMQSFFNMLKPVLELVEENK